METPRAGKAGDGNGTATSGTHDAAPMLALQVSSPALLLNHMAERYTSFGRILSEFVDNSFDAAEPWLEELDHNTASAAAGYSRPVRIAIAIDSERSSVYVTDNASGMDSSTLARVVCRVGDSVKRGMREVNGQFGFGMQAFRSCAQQLVVTSRAESGGGTSRIAVSRNDVTGFVLTEVRAGEPIPDDEYSLLSRSSSTGTEICIAGIDEQWREESMDARAIARELEEHFEVGTSRRSEQLRTRMLPIRVHLPFRSGSEAPTIARVGGAAPSPVTHASDTRRGELRRMSLCDRFFCVCIVA